MVSRVSKKPNPPPLSKMTRNNPNRMQTSTSRRDQTRKLTSPSKIKHNIKGIKHQFQVQGKTNVPQQNFTWCKQVWMDLKFEKYYHMKLPERRVPTDKCFLLFHFIIRLLLLRLLCDFCLLVTVVGSYC